MLNTLTSIRRNIQQKSWILFILFVLAIAINSAPRANAQTDVGVGCGWTASKQTFDDLNWATDINGSSDISYSAYARTRLNSSLRIWLEVSQRQVGSTVDSMDFYYNYGYDTLHHFDRSMRYYVVDAYLDYLLWTKSSFSISAMGGLGIGILRDGKMTVTKTYDLYRSETQLPVNSDNYHSTELHLVAGLELEYQVLPRLSIASTMSVTEGLTNILNGAGPGSHTVNLSAQASLLVLIRL